MPHKSKSPLLSFVLGVFVTLFAAFPLSAAQFDPQLDTTLPTISRMADSNAESRKATYQSNVYIVRLENDAVASYMGDVAGLAATSNRATGATKLDTNSPASRTYASFLLDKQDAFIAHCEAAFGHKINVPFKYQHVVNGVAMELSPDEAAAISALPEVKGIERERFEVPSTDVGPQWINADSIWGDSRGRRHHRGGRGNKSKGEGTVIAVLDTGINHDHPSFADKGGDGYDHENPLGSGNYIPGSYCDANPDFCNDKLIGAWGLVAGPTDPDSPEDSDGHGSHTASTAGGNVVIDARVDAPTTSLLRDISGVAPHANIIAYDVCIDTCPGAALVAAVEQVVKDAAALPDGIDALNYSISGGGNPYNDAIELGFLAAAEAGIYVATSAGNNGPGPSTNGHNSPWLAATAALTHDRIIENSVVDMDSDDAALDDLTGAGFTSGYGPAPIINSADLEDMYPGSTLCGLGSIGDNMPPWPPGTFNGEIVACTRGTFGRVEKGANVLAAGGGGYILMDNGSGIVGDAHVLPGVHISQDDGVILSDWLAANANPTGMISGYFLNIDDANGDIVAGFSSRGPNTAIDVIKPDIGAPGVSILAAVNTTRTSTGDEYGFISGTSMASPHNAGAGALMSAIHPDWSPHQIRSAIMMTAERYSTVKEDGSTPTDHFDVGAGRIDLSKARKPGMVLDETTDNFLAADPSIGGDPRTLNIASMQHSNCVGECSWTRTVQNVAGRWAAWKLDTAGPDGLRLMTDRRYIGLGRDDSGEITVHADTTLAPPGWNFATLELKRYFGPDLHMPIAVYASKSSNSSLLTKTVDAEAAARGEPLNYQIDITNGPHTGEISIVDMLPNGLGYVEGSASETITRGTTINPFSESGGTLTWSGMLDPGGISVVSDPYPPAGSPFGYIPLPSYVAPLECSAACDDTSISLSGLPAFTIGGVAYTDLVMSSNGFIVPGTDDTNAFSNENQNMPDPAAPNAMAPFWTDLDLDGTADDDTGGGQWYAGVFNGGSFIILEWNEVEVWGVPGEKYTVQIQIGTDTSGYPGIWYVYNRLDNTPAALTVGAESADGSSGSNYYYNGTGDFPITGDAGDLKVIELTGGSAQLNFQAKVESCSEGDVIVNRVNLSAEGASELAIAATQCIRSDHGDSDSDSDSHGDSDSDSDSHGDSDSDSDSHGRKKHR